MYFYQKNGFEFESELTEKIAEYSVKEWGKGSFKISTITEDKEQGTDMYVLGVPIDITLNFDSKNRMKKSGILLDVSGFKIRFGIRFGNGHVTFKDPVLVIGMESLVPITRNNLWLAVDAFKESIHNILNTGMDYYFDTIE